MSFENMSKDLSDFQNSMKHVCSSDMQLSKDWYEKMDEASHLVLSSKKDVNLKGKLCKFIEGCYMEAKVNKQRASKLNTFLTEERNKLEELSNEKERLRKKYEKLKDEINSDGKVISDSHSEKLLKFELMAQACKLLTGTDFEYGCSHTSGYMHNHATDVLEVFSLDSADEEKKKEYLWSLMSKVYPIKLNIK